MTVDPPASSAPSDGDRPDELLTADAVEPYLRSRGLLPASAAAAVHVEALGGGVSNVVFGIAAGDRRMVLKQALPRLRVADEWLAEPARVLTEAAALERIGEGSPGAVPPVLDVDPVAYAMVIGRAPEGWVAWKEELLAGRVAVEVAGRLGELLAAWHGLDVAAVERLGDEAAFEQLRVDPYYRTVARRLPDVAAAMGGLIDRMTARRRCLVHGDYSPKNVLVGPDGLWVIDFEVAHLGDPAFDIAFLINHLVLKAIHRPRDRDAYERCAELFWRSYHERVAPGLADDPDHVLAHLGGLLLARVDGKSPAEYLTPDQQDVARRLGRSLLLDPPAGLDAVWTRRAEVTG